MADLEQLERLKQGVEAWNEWRRGNPAVEIDLKENDFLKINLSRANLSRANLSRANLTGVNLNGANLDGANLNGANLNGADLRGTKLRRTKLAKANLANTNLEELDLSKLSSFAVGPGSQYELTNLNLSGANLKKAKLGGITLTRVNLSEADLRGTSLDFARLEEVDLSKANLFRAFLNCTKLDAVNLNEADLSRADMSGAYLNKCDLRNAVLAKTQALGVNFSGAKLTGVCIEDWNINSETKLDDVECDYIYLKYPDKERRPSDPNRNFAPGEFMKLFQKALSTVDLIFRSGVDWQALVISLEKLRVEAEGAELSIQAIENKNDGAFVVRVNVPAEADKAGVEKFLKQEYKVALKALDEKYHYELKAKDIEIESYRRENTNLIKLAEWASNRPIIVQATATAESQSMTERNINTGGGNYNESISGNYIQGNYITMSQDLTQAAAQIQELLTQLQKTGVTVETAQEQVATDLANQAKSDPTVMGKLVGWGQTLANKAGETTVSEAVKAVVPMALKMLGIPL